MQTTISRPVSLTKSSDKSYILFHWVIFNKPSLKTADIHGDALPELLLILSGSLSTMWQCHTILVNCLALVLTCVFVQI